MCVYMVCLRVKSMRVEGGAKRKSCFLLHDGSSSLFLSALTLRTVLPP